MIDCKEIAYKHKEALKKYVSENNLSNKKLAIIQVGDDPASIAYVKGKIADCNYVGIEPIHIWLQSTVEEQILIDTIEEFNRNKNVSGIIVQLPLPKHIDKQKVIDAIADDKDVDGFKATSQFIPCTPKGIMTILDEIRFNPEGKTCMVIGRSDIVGKPIANLLEDAGATVIWCNSKTPKMVLENLMVVSDLIVTATGVKGLITRASTTQVIIDVGITRGEDGKLYGDVDKELYYSRANITPVPGGVGLCTRFALLENTIYGGKGDGKG